MAAKKGKAGWDKLNATQPETYNTDGIVRSKAEEKRLNLLAAETFKGGGPESFLEYLKSITINSISGPHISAEELMHIEGQRWIVAIIEQRIALGKDKKP